MCPGARDEFRSSAKSSMNIIMIFEVEQVLLQIQARRKVKSFLESGNSNKRKKREVLPLSGLHFFFFFLCVGGGAH